MIRNIIFDMGNVIVDVVVPNTYRAFAQLAGISESRAAEIFEEKQFYFNLEIGKTDTIGFRQLLRDSFGQYLTDIEIDKAWCAMLDNLPKNRLERIKELGGSYQVFLLSNTNPIHMRRVFELAAEHGYDFAGLFKSVFYSYQMGFMKPDSGFYLEALKRSNLDINETVFIDDNFDNIQSAKLIGLQSIWLNPLGSFLEKLEPF